MSEFPVDGPITVSVRITSGAVEVVAEEERSSADVDVQPGDARPESCELAEETQVELRGDTLVIATPDRSGWRRRDGSLAVTVRVPRDSSVDAKVASATTACHGRFATVDVDSASGDAYAEHVTGKAVFQTASGDVRTGAVDGALRVKGASGDLKAGRVGGSVDVKTASGDIQIEEAGADVDAKTASGDVRLGATGSGTVRVGTVSGDVGVGVRAGTGVWLDVSTVSGRTRNGLDMGAAPGGDGDGHQLTLQLRTVSGDIDIYRTH
jgi:DUF4097 and DUF4098 domain-containing protein YvlB